MNKKIENQIEEQLKNNLNIIFLKEKNILSEDIEFITKLYEISKKKLYFKIEIVCLIQKNKMKVKIHDFTDITPKESNNSKYPSSPRINHLVLKLTTWLINEKYPRDIPFDNLIEDDLYYEK
jgi:hypothetical protein